MNRTRAVDTLIEGVLSVVVGSSMALLFLYAMTTPDPIREELGLRAAEQAAEIELIDFHECLSWELRAYDDATVDQHDRAVELCGGG